MEVVKQEMARVNVDILEISELKWTGMGEFETQAGIKTAGRNISGRNEEAEPKQKQSSCGCVWW